MAAFAVFGLLLTSVAAIDPRVAAVLKRSDATLTPPSIARRSSGCPNINPVGGSTPGVVSLTCPSNIYKSKSLIGVHQSYINGAPDGCPIVHALDSDMTCTSSMTISDGSCAGYCEMRNFFFYGKEVPFAPVAHCSTDEVCAIQTSQSATLEQTYTFNLGATLGQRSENASELTERGDDAPEALLKAAFNGASGLAILNSKQSLTIPGSIILLVHIKDNNKRSYGHPTN